MAADRTKRGPQANQSNADEHTVHHSISPQGPPQTDGHRPDVADAIEAHVPSGLKNRPQWVAWKRAKRTGKDAKVPISPRTGKPADLTEESTWATFDDAIHAMRGDDQIAGVGYVFSADDPFCGIDIDGCIVDHRITSGGDAIIDSLASYSEISPSGRGIKVIVEARKPDGAKCKRTGIDGTDAIEVYDQKRFFTITGQRVEGTPRTVEERQSQIDDLCQHLWPKADASRRVRNLKSPHVGTGFKGSDDELIEAASRSRNGDKFKRLFDGDASTHGEDESRADLALCRMLAFWTGPDAERIDRIFRRSGLYRPKWDRQDYRDRTVAAAIASCDESYSPRSGSESIGAASLPAPPVLRGPHGIALTVIGVSKSPRRHSARFEVAVNEIDSSMELTATDTETGIQTAFNVLMEIVRVTRPEPELNDEQREDVRRWLRTVLTMKALTELGRQLNAYQEHERALVESEAPRRSMFEIAHEHMISRLNLAFCDDDGNAWSERYGRPIKPHEFTSQLAPNLLEEIKHACDYPKPTQKDPTKPIVHLQRVLKVCWTAITDSLPDELHADQLGPDSKAAQSFRAKIVHLWMTPETWMKIEPKDGEPGHVERMSLASRVRELIHLTKGRKPHWARVLRGVNAFYRIEKNEASNPVVWLAMRADLCHGEIKGVRIDNIQSQADLTTLMARYGLADTGTVTHRIREDDLRSRLCVLSRELCDYLIHCVDLPVECPGPNTDTRCGPAAHNKLTHDEESEARQP